MKLILFLSGFLIVSGLNARLQVTAAHAEEMSGVLSIHYDELLDTKKEVDAYTSPTERLYMVSGKHAEYFMRAISKKARDKWAQTWLKNPEHKKKFDDLYDAIAAAAAKKFPVYLPDSKKFAFHNKAEEGMMRSVLRNAATLKIHKIGQFHNSWQISREGTDLPDARYKQGYVWAKDSADDYPYCHLYQVNIIQKYAGGGTYGESFAKVVGDTVLGCP
jgi:hypothetical protein